MKYLFILCMVISCGKVTSLQPVKDCCGTLIPSYEDGLTKITATAKTPSASYEHEIRMLLSEKLHCSIHTIEVHLTPSAGGPNITSANPVILTFSGCSRRAGAIYLQRYTSFAFDPTGYEYDVILTYKDINGFTVANYAASYSLQF